MIERKKIAWITPSAFLDTDIYIVPLLRKYFSIDWYIVKREEEVLDYADMVEKTASDVNVRIIKLGKRYRSLKTFFRYLSFFVGIRNRYDLIYTSMSNFPYHTPLLAMTNRVSRCVMAIHNVHVPKGGTNYSAMNLYTDLTIRLYKNFQTFSCSQYDELLKQAGHKRIMKGSFILKDYGAPSTKRIDTRISFLSFGCIRDYKRLDVLIDAAEDVYQKYGNVFRIMIAGEGSDWEKYQKRIKHPEVFDLRIERISNEDIPEIFNQCDYFVTPYQDIAQSGSLMVAINYDKPVIASRLKAFEECIEDKKTGFFIAPADKDDLAEAIGYAIENHNGIYGELVSNIKTMKKERFSADAVVSKYKEFFEEVCK